MGFLRQGRKVGGGGVQTRRCSPSGGCFTPIRLYFNSAAGARLDYGRLADGCIAVVGDFKTCPWVFPSRATPRSSRFRGRCCRE